jgi:uncharacterized protein (TIGR03086 family)
MTDLRELHRRAAAEFDRRVQAISADQWDQPTPCEEWDVRTLVNHLVSDNRWAPELLAGATIDDVGDAFDGDMLGDDPVTAWEDSIEAALTAFEDDDALDRIVHLSFGDVPAAVYASQRTTDLTVHAWDLARAIGADESLDAELVTYCYETALAQEDLIRASGLFGDPPPGPDDASVQTRLLAFFGRSA